MYQITNITDGTTHISDTLVLIRLNCNGSYTQPKKGETAQGFVAKIPATYERPVFDDEGNETGETETVETLADTVFRFNGQIMKGTEPIGSYEEVPAVPVITELEGDLAEAYELLYGGKAE